MTRFKFMETGDGPLHFTRLAATLLAGPSRLRHRKPKRAGQLRPFKAGFLVLESARGGYQVSGYPDSSPALTR